MVILLDKLDRDHTMFKNQNAHLVNHPSEVIKLIQFPKIMICKLIQKDVNAQKQ